MDLQTCQWHPSRATGLKCTRCGTPVCVECAFQHPVGVRCKECVRAHTLPTYQISTPYLLRGVLGMLGLGTLGAAISYVALNALPNGLLIFLAFMLGLGYMVGEGVSICVNRRRGGVYLIFGAGAAVIASSPWMVPYFTLLRSLNDLSSVSDSVGIIAPIYLMVGIFISIVVAFSRLRR